MLTLARSLSLRYLLRRWERATLVVASIALGVATLVSTRLLNQAIETVAHEPVAFADLYVTNGEAGVRGELAEHLRQTVPGLKRVQPIIVERVQLPDLDNRLVVLLGIEQNAQTVGGDNPLGVQVRFAPTGELFLAVLSGRAVLIGQGLADDLKRTPDGGRRVRIRATGPVVELLPAGTIAAAPDSPAATLGRNLLVMDIPQAARVLGRPGLVSRIDLFVNDRNDLDRVESAVAEALGGQAMVQRPEAHGQASQEIISGAQASFTLCGLGALVVGLFLVYNALSVNVAERRSEIGILRSVGATRGQIGRLFAGEALALGLAGSVLGLPVGWGLARLALSLLGDVLNDLAMGTGAPVRIGPGLVLLALAAGTGTALLAALIPAFQAASDAPVDAVRRVPSSASRLLFGIQVLASAVLVGTGVGFVLGRSYLPYRWGSYGGVTMTLVGLLLATPMVASALAHLLRPVARALLGIEARLAADNLLRAPARTGVVIGALAAAVALILQIAGVGRSNKEPVLAWIDRALTADLFVGCGAVGENSSVAMAPEIGRDLKDNIPGVESVLSVRTRRLEFNGRSVLLLALDTPVYYEAHRRRSPFPGLEQFRLLSEPGTALASQNFASLHRVGVGDTVTLPGPRGSVPLRIVGIVEDYSWNRGTLILDHCSYGEAFDDRLMDFFDLFLRDGATEEEMNATKQAVESYGVRLALKAMTRPELQARVSGLIRRLFALAYVQVVVVGVVAGLGVVTALLISVLQRRRELGLLRAAGATQGQALRSVLAEAALMGLIGTVFGICVGLPLEWYIVRVVVAEESGFDFPVLIPWVESAVVTAAAVGLATLAGLWPAWQAVRLQIAEAIAYE